MCGDISRCLACLCKAVVSTRQTLTTQGVAIEASNTTISQLQKKVVLLSKRVSALEKIVDGSAEAAALDNGEQISETEIK